MWALPQLTTTDLVPGAIPCRTSWGEAPEAHTSERVQGFALRVTFLQRDLSPLQGCTCSCPTACSIMLGLALAAGTVNCSSPLPCSAATPCPWCHPTPALLQVLSHRHACPAATPPASPCCLTGCIARCSCQLLHHSCRCCARVRHGILKPQDNWVCCQVRGISSQSALDQRSVATKSSLTTCL